MNPVIKIVTCIFLNTQDEIFDFRYICLLIFILFPFFSGQNRSDNATCKSFVSSALKYHNRCKSDNGDVCLMGKYHNLLYIAMKLAFDWSLQDNGIVAALLDEMYACEGTFERIFLGW